MLAEISDTLLKQRLRNRIIENLDSFAGKSGVEKIGTDEVIECWYDIVDDDRLNFYDEPVFTKNEINVIKRFHNLLGCNYEKIPTTWSFTDVEDNFYWRQLAEEAKYGMDIFMDRGYLDEDNEVT